MHKHVHLIGIGGIGMSGIAHLLLKNGAKVSGSDLKDGPILAELRALGCKVYIGHSPENAKSADVVVYSSAIKEDNPEMQEAKRNGITVMQRAQMLAELMLDKKVLTVTGAHGKTTVTSLASHLLIEAGFSPTVAIGGILRNLDSNASLGSGDYFVAEADESDGSFLYYKPDYSIITNIDYEHLDYYRDFANIVDTFRKFLDNTKEGGCVFCCGDDTNLKNILRDYKRRFLLFGLSGGSDIYADNISIKGLASRFDCLRKGKRIDTFRLSLGGRHNVSNALAVIAVGLELGIKVDLIKNSLASYQGAKRRLQTKLDYKGIRVLDDYGHHPTEIQATLSALSYVSHSRIIAVFQPHRFSRTKFLLEDFGRSFKEADYVIITDIYPASEPPIAGITGRSVYDKIKMNGHKEVHFLPKEEIVKHLTHIARPGDLIITLGAGDITRISDELAEAIKRKT